MAGMTGLGELVVFIGADNTDLIKKTNQSKSKLREFAASVDKTMTKAGRSMQRFGRSMNRWVTLPILGATAAVLKFSGDFEKSMNLVQAVTGSTADEFSNLRNQAKQLGITTQFTASQAADGMATLAKAGFDVNKILTATPRVLELAAAGQIDLARASKIVTGILAGYSLEAEDLIRTNDVLTKTFISTKTTIDTLGEGFTDLGPVARNVGIEFEEAAALLGQFGQVNLEGTRAGLALSNTIINLSQEAGRSNNLLKKYGITIADTAGNFLPFIDILRQFEQLQKKVNNEVEFTAIVLNILDKRAGRPFLGLLRRGSEELATLTQELKDVGGTTQKIAAVQMQGFIGAMRELRSAIEGAAIAMGDAGFLDVATRVGKFLAQQIRSFAKLDDAILNQITKWGLLTATIGPFLTIGGGILIFFGTFVSAVITATAAMGTFILALGGAIGGVGLGIIALIGVIAILIASFTDLSAIWEGGANAFRDFVRFMTGRNKDLADSTKSTVEFIGESWIGLKIAFNTTKVLFTKFAKFMIDSMGKLAADFLSIAGFIPATRAIASGLSSALEQMSAPLQAKINELENDTIELAFALSDVPNTIQKSADGFKAAFDVVLAAIEQVPLVGRVKEIVAEIKAAFASLGLVGSGSGAALFPLGGIEEALNTRGIFGGGGGGVGQDEHPFLSRLSEALEKNAVSTQDWANVVLSSIDSVSTAFTDMFVDVIQGTGNFAKTLGSLFTSMAKMVLDIMFKMIFEKIAMLVVNTMMNAAASAPSPFLIPVFVGVALAAIGGILGGTGFEGAMGGSGQSTAAPPTPPPSAVASVIEPETDMEQGSEITTLVLEEGEGNKILEFLVRQTENGVGDGSKRLALVGA